MITTFYPPYSFGGDGNFVQALSRGLAGRGHSVDVVHCVDSYESLAASAPGDREIEPAGVTVHPLRSSFGILSPLATQQTGRPLLKSAQILRILNSKRFDVIHFHNVSLVGGPGLLRLGKAIKLYTLHEHWLLCPMHTLFRDQVELCTGKRCISCSLRYKRPPQWWRYTGLLNRSLQEVDLFLAPTEFTREIHRKSGLPMRDIRVLENFHQPCEQPYEQREEEMPTRKFFLFVGRLEKLKGVSDLIEAIRPNREAGLVIAGDGAELEPLRAMAGGCDHIRFVGRIGQDRLARLYREAIAVVIPSLAYEVFALVMLEAFAQGTPVIARNRGSLAEIVHRSQGGILFDDVEGLRRALTLMRTSPGLREKLGAAGRRTWRERWTLDAHLSKYMGMIGEFDQQEPGKNWASESWREG